MPDLATIPTELIHDKPAAVIRSRIEGEKALAAALKGLVLSSCVIEIQGKPYVTVTGLTAVARGLGLTVLETACGKNDSEGGYVATAEIRDETDRVVGRGSGFVAYDEAPWSSRPEFARRAMACTRAAGRALRLVLAPVIVGMGYEAVAAEEMPRTPSKASAPLEEPDAPQANEGRAKGIPEIIKTNAGKSGEATLAGVGMVEVWINDAASKALVEVAAERGLEVDLAWKRRGKWFSCVEVSHAIPF